MDSVLRPRDIQARIRAGESPERVAEAAQTTTDRIMAFAAPVLAERAYVAQQAQKASVRRRAGDGPIGQLGDAVASRLADREVRVEDVEWDAWRREDGRWTLVAEYAVAGSPHRAQFAYDAAGRYVVAEDDEARALVGERSGADRAEQLPLGDDAIEVVTGRRPQPPVPDRTVPDRTVPDRTVPDRTVPDRTVSDRTGEPSAGGDAGDEPTVDLTDTASAVRPEPFPSGPVRPDAPDWISTQATERPAPRPERPERPAAARAEEPGEALFEASELTTEPAAEAPAGPTSAAPAPTEPAGGPTQPSGPADADTDRTGDQPAGGPAQADADPAAGQGPDQGAEPAAGPAAGPAAEPERPAQPRKRTRAKSKGRASVPSWDEIMFGSGSGSGRGEG